MTDPVSRTYLSLGAFYASDPARRASRERDVGLRGVTCRDDEGGTLAGEPDRGVQPEPAGHAGDDGTLAGEVGDVVGAPGHAATLLARARKRCCCRIVLAMSWGRRAVVALLPLVLAAAFPDHPPYGGRYPDPRPHVTLDRAGPGVDVETVRRWTAPLTPARMEVDEVRLSWYEQEACRTLATWPLG